MRERRPIRKFARASYRVGCEFCTRHDRVVKAPALTLGGIHRPPGEEQFGGPSLADEAWKHCARAHVAPGEANAREEERRFCFWCRNAKVGSHRENRTSA